ncbi:TPA: hypothetical protein ACWXAU_005550, partial [Klebsiella pneumoniae]
KIKKKNKKVLYKNMPVDKWITPRGEVIFQAFSVSRIYKFCSLVLPRSLGASPCRSAAASTAGSIYPWPEVRHTAYSVQFCWLCGIQPCIFALWKF